MWMSRLRGDPLNWLLEPDPANPGVRYFALRDLLDRAPDDPELAAAQAAVMASGPAPAILAAQAPEGYWAKAGVGYSPKYRATSWQIIFLAELGADPADVRVRRGCDYLLSHMLAANGAFTVYQTRAPHGALHCLNGNLLYALARLGYGDDPRVRGALDWQVRAILGDDGVDYYASGTSGPGFACGVNLGQPCAWGALKALKALAAVPGERRTPALQRAIQAGVDLLLSRDPAAADYTYTERVSPMWFQPGFPLSYWGDVLETAVLLVELGYGRDARLERLLELVLSKQDAQGRWKLANSLNGKMWIDIERRGKPSKWVTLRVLRMLKRLASSNNTGQT